MLYGDRDRYYVRRMADSQDDGAEGGKTKARRWFLRRVRRRHNIIRLIRIWHTCKHDAYYHRRYYGHRLASAPERREMGSCRQDHLGVGINYPVLSDHIGIGLYSYTVYIS